MDFKTGSASFLRLPFSEFIAALSQHEYENKLIAKITARNPMIEPIIKNLLILYCFVLLIADSKFSPIGSAKIL